MNKNSLPAHEELPSGKVIRRLFNSDGSLAEEIHGYGAIEIAINFKFRNGIKIDETYLSKSRLVGRRSYEKARVNYPDMPAPDTTSEDWGDGLMKEVRAEQKRRKFEREKRLAESEESKFSRPTSTNWLRVIAKNSAHLVVFASRDWKILQRETSIPNGRFWLRAFGFGGAGRNTFDKGSMVMEGLVIGYEVIGDRAEMLETSKTSLNDVVQFVNNPPETTYFHSSIRPRRKPRPAPVIVWPTALPPLIDYLTTLSGRR